MSDIEDFFQEYKPEDSDDTTLEYTVKLPSGAPFPIYQQEEEYVLSLIDRYTKDNSFTNISDLSDLDRVIMLETLSWRWGIWISQGHDYDGEPIEAAKYRTTIKDWSSENRQIKKQLGIDKSTRDSQRGEGSVYSYLIELRKRAKEFGIVREKQLDKALELTNELISLVQFHDNATEQERKEFDGEVEDIIEWIRTVYIPEFQQISEYFAHHQRKYWKKL